MLNEIKHTTLSQNSLKVKNLCLRTVFIAIALLLSASAVLDFYISGERHEYVETLDSESEAEHENSRQNGDLDNELDDQYLVGYFLKSSSTSFLVSPGDRNSNLDSYCLEVPTRPPRWG